MSDFIITFLSTHNAMKAEKELKKTVPEITLIPTPREISSECGFVLSIGIDSDELFRIMENISYEAIYHVITKNKFCEISKKK